MDRAPVVTAVAGRLAVVGAGTMGAGIAQVALEAGWAVTVHDPAPGAFDRGRARIADGLRRRAAKHGLTRDAAREWVEERLGHLVEVRTLGEAAAEADLVIEAAIEDLAAKRAIFADLDSAAGHRTILATNTSALSIAAIAEAAVRHPERVLGLHFFNPAPVMLLVEVVPGRRTDEAVTRRATEIVRGWGKVPVRSTDTAGFIVNRVNRPFTIEALRMVEAGDAHVAEIDEALRDAGFPMGPFELMDLVGLDVNLAAATAVWEGLGRPDRLRPSPIQARLVADGSLGRKTGSGFYRYTITHDPVPNPLAHAVARPVPLGHVSDPAGIVGRIRAAIAAEAALARDAGVASEADIDTALWLGAGHPQGPFAWARGHDPTIHA
ncbi:MAG: 3-hydroxybutyryl-CoA dehydrogenase [Chloroflexi bacterium]|nr:3-hydroxybutyryl-CoA dehydrogenase [Chloroflexota bacterium]